MAGFGHNSVLKVGISALALAALSGIAAGQNALDKNLQTGSGGINPRKPTIQEELRIRDAIVTGNAPGGMSFRGDVGYRAPGDFSSRLGSNDNFAFRRDSVYSGLGGQGLRGTDALQYQFAYTTGRFAPSNIGTPMFINRSGASANASDVRGSTSSVPTAIVPGRGPGRALDDTLSTDTRGLSLMMLRSPAAYVSNRTLVPSSMGVLPGPDGTALDLVASPLRGVAFEPAFGRRDTRTRPGEVPEPRPGQQTDTRVPSERDTLPAGQTPEPLGDTRLDPIDEVHGRLAKARGEEFRKGGLTTGRPGQPGEEGDDGQKPVENWRDRLDKLRRELAEEDRQAELKAQDAARTRDAEKDKPKDGESSRPSGSGLVPSADPEASPAPGARATPASRDRDTIEMLRAAGSEPVVRFAPDGFDAYSEHMIKGQEHLAAGRYFDAEQRFVAALSAKAGDVMAGVGRVHAQIGAGMFVSASIGVRSMLTDHPEIMAVRYDAKLLPKPERLDSATARLRELVAADRAKAKDSALLLAYIGHQRGDRKLTVEGLDAFDASLAAGQVAGIAPDSPDARLAGILREVWLNPLLPPGGRAAPQEPKR